MGGVLAGKHFVLGGEKAVTSTMWNYSRSFTQLSGWGRGWSGRVWGAFPHLQELVSHKKLGHAETPTHVIIKGILQFWGAKMLFSPLNYPPVPQSSLPLSIAFITTEIFKKKFANLTNILEIMENITTSYHHLPFSVSFLAEFGEGLLSTYVPYGDTIKKGSSLRAHTYWGAWCIL